MTWRGCAADAGGSEPAAAPEIAAPLANLQAPLRWRLTADGSPSLWSDAFGQAFHCHSGARREAEAKFMRPAQLQRFPPGSRLVVVEVCVGLGYNTAALLEGVSDHGLSLDWWGLELDPQPLALALGNPRFRDLWRPQTLTALEQLRDRGHWRQAGLESGQNSSGRWWLGDARQQLHNLPPAVWGCCDLVLLDAFSPGQCPQLWTLEFLGHLAALLSPHGRLLTYCSAAAVRHALQRSGLQLASLRPVHEQTERRPAEAAQPGRHWSDGTVASPAALPSDALLRHLDGMEQEHLLTRAAVPYRDPLGNAEPEAIRTRRRLEQERNPALSSTSAWRRRWGIET